MLVTAGTGFEGHQVDVMDEHRIRWLNARLPTKRAIGQGLIRSSSGRVLLCQLTYKEAWDLPGGVVEPGESPQVGCLREVHEELGLRMRSHGLLAVNWMEPWRGWDDACTFLFDLGVHDETTVESMVFEAREIAAVHWCAAAQIERFAAPATARLLLEVLTGLDQGHCSPRYLENAAEPWPDRS